MKSRLDIVKFRVADFSVRRICSVGFGCEGESLGLCEDLGKVVAYPSWVCYEFSVVYLLSEIRIFLESSWRLLDRGIRDVSVCYSVDGKSWQRLCIEGKNSFVVPKDEELFCLKFTDIRVRYLAIAVNYESGNYGSDCSYFSGVEFIGCDYLRDKQSAIVSAVSVCPENFYKYDNAGRACRVVRLCFHGTPLYFGAIIEYGCVANGEMFKHTIASCEAGITEEEILLPVGVAVCEDYLLTVNVYANNVQVSAECLVPPLRQWTIFLLPHSHVTINDERDLTTIQKIHAENIREAIRLARDTADYPEGAKFCWNVEVLWAVKEYLQGSGERERLQFVEAVKKGWICLDAAFANICINRANPEELRQLFSFAKQLAKECEISISSMLQVDSIQGIESEIIPILQEEGIKYLLSIPSMDFYLKNQENPICEPIYRQDSITKAKILFLQTYPYHLAYRQKGWLYHQQISSPNPQPLKTDSPQNNFLESFLFHHLAEQQQNNYPYSHLILSWCLADNSPIDADLPNAVQAWNKKYAFPKIHLASTQKACSQFEKLYKQNIPTITNNDKQLQTKINFPILNAINKQTKELVQQIQILWNSFKPKKYPNNKLQKIWGNILLADEYSLSLQSRLEQNKTEQTYNHKKQYTNQAHTLAKTILQQALLPEKNKSTITIYNTSTYTRSNLITIPKKYCTNITTITADTGEPIPCQKLSSGKLIFYAKDIPPCNKKCFKLTTTTHPCFPPQKTATITKQNIITPYYQITIDKSNGAIKSIFSNKYNYDLVAPNSYINQCIYQNSTNKYHPHPCQNPNIYIKSNGLLIATIIIESTINQQIKLTQTIKLFNNQEQIQISNTITTTPSHNKEIITFNFDFNIPNPTIQYQNITKPKIYHPTPNPIHTQSWIHIANQKNAIALIPLETPLTKIIPNPTIPQQYTIQSLAYNHPPITPFPLAQPNKLTFHYTIHPHPPANYQTLNHLAQEITQPLITQYPYNNK